MPRNTVWQYGNTGENKKKKKKVERAIKEEGDLGGVPIPRCEPEEGRCKQKRE